MSLIPVNERLASIEALVRAQAQEIKLLTSRLARSAEGRNPRLARTTSTGTYPTRADARNCWEICFVDATFDEEAGVQTVDVADRRLASPFPVAHNIFNDPFIPDGTLVNVWRDNNRWWFEYEDEIQVAILQGTLTAGGSVSVKVQVGGVNTPGGAVTAYDKLGVMSGVADERALIKWQREHAEYWILNKECDDSVGVALDTWTPPAVWWPARAANDRARRAALAGGFF